MCRRVFAEMYFSKLLVLLAIIQGTKGKEYCMSDEFQATCGTKEVIVMTSAQYGRLALGRCVDEDIGHLGYSNDALEVMDELCSGKASCEFPVVKQTKQLWRDDDTACPKALMGYLDVEFTCKQVTTIQQESCRSRQIKLTSQQTLLTSASLAACGATSDITLLAGDGQTMNISLWNFKISSQSFGTLRDKLSGNTVDLTTSSRFSHLTSSVGKEMTLHLDRLQESNFIIDVTVSGCANMSPPEGAWMTRDGDVIEIGCHSGSKTWTLTCEHSKWIGVIGYCGQDSRQKKPNLKGGVIKNSDTSVLSVSPNVLVFGVSSLIILCSACIFLAGVIVLKRKLTQKKSSWQPMTSHVLVADEHSSFVHPDGMHIKQFTHGPLVDLNESAQYFALEDSIVNK